MATIRQDDFESHRKMMVDLLTAAENGDLPVLQTTIQLIKTKTKAKTTEEVISGFKDGNKRTAMHFAAAKGRRKVIEYILEQVPASLNVQDGDGSSPLFLAARENEFAAVKLLLSRGADVNVAQKSGAVPMHEAAANGSVRTVKLLHEHHADVNAMSKNGSPLHYAVNEGREKTITELLALGADVNAKNEKGVSPLVLSCMLNKPAIAKELLAANADATVTLGGGLTALHIAAEAGFVEIVKLLLELRREETVAMANSKFDGGATPLQLAAGKHHTEIVGLLQPITQGYEDHHVASLIEQEKQKMDKYLVEATKSAPLEEITETEEEKHKRKVLEGVVPDADIVVPEAVELDEAALARVLAVKDQGNQAFAAKNFSRSIELYTEAIGMNPADAVLYSNRCAAYLARGEAKKALNDIRLAKKLKPEWVKAHFREGQCLEVLGLFEDAAVAMWEAIQLQPKDKALEKKFQDVVAKGRAQAKAKADAAKA